MVFLIPLVHLILICSIYLETHSVNANWSKIYLAKSKTVNSGKGNHKHYIHMLLCIEMFEVRDQTYLAYSVVHNVGKTVRNSLN